MIDLKEGEKRLVKLKIKRASGDGAITLTTPQRRILTSALNVAAGFDWAAAAWSANDADESGEISALFDSGMAALATPGFYYMQLRGVIGSECYSRETRVDVLEFGPNVVGGFGSGGFGDGGFGS